MRDLWQSNRPFDELPPDQQAAVAQRWQDSTRGQIKEKRLAAENLALASPKQWLLTMQTTISIEPRLLFTVGTYVRTAETGTRRLHCVWEAKLVI